MLPTPKRRRTKRRSSLGATGVRIGALFLGRPDPRAWRLYDDLVSEEHSINTADAAKIQPKLNIALSCHDNVYDRFNVSPLAGL